MSRGFLVLKSTLSDPSESAVTHVQSCYLPKVLELKHPNSCHWLHTQQQTLIAATVEAWGSCKEQELHLPITEAHKAQKALSCPLSRACVG